MILYSMVPFDCSGKVNWLLNELGIDFENKTLSWKEGDLRTPEYLKLNPVGEVPVLDDNGYILHESYAIVSYLADKHIDKGLAPQFSDIEKRGKYYQWMQFATSTAASYFDKYFKMENMPEDYKKDWEEFVKNKVQATLKAIDSELTGKEYLLGEFSAADICMADSLYMISEESFFNDFPNVSSYFEKLKGREAALKSKMFSAPSS